MIFYNVKILNSNDAFLIMTSHNITFLKRCIIKTTFCELTLRSIDVYLFPWLKNL